MDDSRTNGQDGFSTNGASMIVTYNTIFLVAVSTNTLSFRLLAFFSNLQEQIMHYRNVRDGGQIEFQQH